MKTSMLASFAVMLLVVAMMSGCGGGGSDLAPTNPPAPFTPVSHNGYAVYLIGGQWDQSYIAQTSADAFRVTAGVYKPVCLRATQVSTAMMNTCGGIDWPGSFTLNGQALSPTERGWVFAPGNTYNGTMPNPGGGEINFTVTVVATDFNGMTVTMVPTDLSGEEYDTDPTTGHYQIPCYSTFVWVAKWSIGGQVINQERYGAYANKITGADTQYADGGYYSTVISVSNYAIYAYDKSVNEMGGDQPVAVGIVTIDFTASQEIGHQPGVG